MAGAMDKYAPKNTGIRDPRDAKKKNGVIHNPPRYLAIGGKGNTSDPQMKPKDSSVGPISDRGRGRR